MFREAYTRFGGPDGGNGGRGGNVIIVADSTLRSLSGILTNYSAERGTRGQGGQSFGRNGRDVILKVFVHSEASARTDLKVNPRQQSITGCNDSNIVEGNCLLVERKVLRVYLFTISHMLLIFKNMYSLKMKDSSFSLFCIPFRIAFSFFGCFAVGSGLFWFPCPVQFIPQFPFVLLLVLVFCHTFLDQLHPSFFPCKLTCTVILIVLELPVPVIKLLTRYSLTRIIN